LGSITYYFPELPPESVMIIDSLVKVPTQLGVVAADSGGRPTPEIFVVVRHDTISERMAPVLAAVTAQLDARATAPAESWEFGALSVRLYRPPPARARPDANSPPGS